MVATVTSKSETAPPLATVYRAPDGSICHAWCGRPLQFQGYRGGIELDFYCQRCLEHVTVPECILSRVPRIVTRPPAAARD